MKEKLKELLAQKAELDEQILQCKWSLINEHQKEIDAKGFGTVTVDGLVFNIPKNVSYDQEGLAKLYEEAGAEYIDVKYNVSESKYNAWPEVIRKQFTPLRTVKAGAISVKIKE